MSNLDTIFYKLIDLKMYLHYSIKIFGIMFYGEPFY